MRRPWIQAVAPVGAAQLGIQSICARAMGSIQATKTRSK